MIQIRSTPTGPLGDAVPHALAAMGGIGVWGGAVHRVIVALALPLMFVIAAPARAQCPSVWVPGIGTVGTNGPVNALAVLSTGDVIAGGGFSQAGGVICRSIARYNPPTNSWRAVGTGTNGGVSALAVLPGDDLIVGGLFTMAGGQSGRNNIARCNPWAGVYSAMGAGTNGQVLALAVIPGGDVIAGGAFTTADNVGMSRVARYIPTTNVWSALGSGTNNTVVALAVLPGGDVIVGGHFTTAGDGAASRIARYNPGTWAWSALGSGTNGSVNALAVLPACAGGGGDVIVGGSFSTAGGVPASNIARINLTTGVWTALGTGSNGTVMSLAVLSSGDVIVGGQFTAAGGVAASNIARCNPTTGVWTAMGAGGSGTNSDVTAAAVLSGGDVIVSGSFTTAGGVAASRVARLFPGAPAPSIISQPLPVVTAPSGSAFFGVTASGDVGSGTPTYQWRKGGVAIDIIANPSAATPVLSITNVQAADLGSYDCLVTNSCGGTGVASNAATLTFVEMPACPADFNMDGGIDGADVADFFFRWENGC